MVLNWRYDANRHHPKPWRVADSPTRHRPQISVRFRAHKRAKPPAATEGFITEANMEITDLARSTSLSRALDNSTVPAIPGGVQ